MQNEAGEANEETTLAADAAPRGKPAGPDAAALRERALRLLARRDYPRAELERKLLAFCASQSRTAGSDGFADDSGDDWADAADQGDRCDAADASARVIKALLDQLAARGLLSDTRYAENRVRARASRYGNARLEQELRQRGVDAEVRAEALASGGDEFERARALWQRRFGKPPADAGERARQMRHLAARGFSGDVVRRVLAAARDASDEVREDDEAC